MTSLLSMRQVKNRSNIHRKELELLSKLYGLYNNVLESVKGYYEMRWSDLNVSLILKDLGEFENK